MTEPELFAAAIGFADPAQRAAFLDRECADRLQMRERLELLLDAHFRSYDLLDAPGADPPRSRPDHAALGPTANYAPDLVAGTLVAGRYKLLQQIGEGGMGSVWMADQTEPVRRRVAVKLIRVERGQSKTILSRFEAERQAIALMDHPNIAKLLDAGTTETGSPFFVMELVKGKPLTDFCDEHRLGIPQRLALFVQVCSAVQHAHQKGVIHRDLKPTNILVESHDGKPVPKVIDFGLAKATTGLQLTDHTLFTAFGSVMGTPLYMAPEQATFNAIDVDTRADVYALGVILYELLTGTTPLTRETVKKAALDEMLRMIREQEAPTPSSRLSSAQSQPSVAANRQTEPAKLGRFLKGELDWIVLKALSKERDRRYETANGFAKDIERFLAHEPVTAGPPSASYRLKKFVRRNRAQVIAASLIVVTLVVGIAGTTVGLIRAEQLRRRAENERQKAERAEADTLADYRASTDEVIEQLIGSKPALGPQEKSYLEKTLKRWQAFADRTGEDERSRAIRAEGHKRVAFLWQKLGRLDEARVEYEQARSLWKAMADQFPSVPAYQQFLAGTHHDLGILFADLQKWHDARTEYEAARDLQRKLADQFPNIPKHRQDLAGVHNALGLLLEDLGKQAEALAEYEAARDLGRRLADQFPTVSEYQHDLAGTHNNLGNVLTSLGRRDEARTEYEKARDLHRRVADQVPAMPSYQQFLAVIHNNLGNLLSRLGKRGEARTEYEAARDLQRKLADQFPAVPVYQQELAITRNNLGILLLDLERRDEARTEFQKARDLQRQLADLYPNVPGYQTGLANTHNNLGNVLTSLGRRDEARAEYETARRLQRQLVDRFPAVPDYEQSLANTHNNLALLFTDMNKRAEARTEYETAHDLRRRLAERFPTMPSYQSHLGTSFLNFGVWTSGDGKPAESIAWFDKAIQTFTALHEQEREDVATTRRLRNCHRGRAMAFDQLGKHVDAVKDWDKAIAFSPAPEQPGARASRAKSRVLGGQVVEGMAEVAELLKSSNWTASQWYDYACVYAVASSKDTAKKQEYGDQAMALLQTAVAQGWNKAAHMAKDSDLDSLRDRADFKMLVSDLEARSPLQKATTQKSTK